MVSGGAAGSERSVCWAKSGKGANTTTTTTFAKPGYIDIKLSKSGAAPFEFSSVVGEHVNGKQDNIIGQPILRANYPPSPPATATITGSEILAPAKPLTIANVAAIEAGGSPFSAISTSPTSEGSASDSSSEDASELSFLSASETPASLLSGEAASKQESFLASVFGDSHQVEFAKLGVQVTVPSADILEDEDAAEPVFKASAILGVAALGTKTLYLAPHIDRLDREGLVDLFEIADEDLGCSGIVICLDKKANAVATAALAETLHALMYVGGSIVPPDAGIVKYNSEDYILVGLDL